MIARGPKPDYSVLLWWVVILAFSAAVWGALFELIRWAI